MLPFSLNEQTVYNALVLIFGLVLSFFGTLVSARGNPVRAHNLTRLFNEAVSRANLAIVSFLLSLLIFRVTTPMSRAVIGVAALSAVVAWVISLYMLDNITERRMKDQKLWHNCEPPTGPDANPEKCAHVPTFTDIASVSRWNLGVFGTMVLMGFLIAFSISTETPTVNSPSPVSTPSPTP